MCLDNFLFSKSSHSKNYYLGCIQMIKNVTKFFDEWHHSQNTTLFDVKLYNFCCPVLFKEVIYSFMLIISVSPITSQNFKIRKSMISVKKKLEYERTRMQIQVLNCIKLLHTKVDRFHIITDTR
jgi:hypothetical protein